jgi:hypothetical protein
MRAETTTGVAIAAGRVAAALVVVAAALPAAAGEALGTRERPTTVVELFTSQGCSNCPPADALVRKMSTEPGVVALSYSVDYWDYLGWKDTAARPEFTRRQRAYAETRGDRSIYTPQVVINGRLHAVGSDRTAIDRQITALTDDGRLLDVPVDFEVTREALVIRIGDVPEDRPRPSATVWLIHFEKARTVQIGRGENSGRVVTYANLVRSMQPVGMWKGTALRLELPRRETTSDPNGGCAVLVQVDTDGAPGPILGARILVAEPKS